MLLWGARRCKIQIAGYSEVLSYVALYLKTRKILQRAWPPPCKNLRWNIFIPQLISNLKKNQTHRDAPKMWCTPSISNPSVKPRMWLCHITACVYAKSLVAPQLVRRQAPKGGHVWTFLLHRQSCMVERQSSVMHRQSSPVHASPLKYNASPV